MNPQPLLLVSYIGDFSGTKIEKEVKTWCSNSFAASVCNEDQLEVIYQRIGKKCEELAAASPRCKKPEVRMDVFRGIRDSVYISLLDDTGLHNSSLLVFKPVEHYYGDILNYVNGDLATVSTNTLE